MSVYTEHSRRNNYGGPGSLWRKPSKASPVSLPETMLTPRNFRDRTNFPNFVGPMHPDKFASKSNPHGYHSDNYLFQHNPEDFFYYDDSEDLYKDNPIRDDFYVQDPFSEVWGNQGGPLRFG